jgi:DNA-binding transcriptional LysR family regulator
MHSAAKKWCGWPTEDDILTFERQVTGHDLRPSGELRVTTNDTLLVHLLSDVLAAFRRAYPEISLDVLVSNQSLNLSKRDADAALRASSDAGALAPRGRLTDRFRLL